LVVGSNAGDARHPGWCYNLAKNPEGVWAEVEGRRRQVTPHSLSGPERERAWSEVVEKSPTYGRYAAKTDRVIPIIRLIASG
jgi:deazaflavin-dependent oxidoreductase (nitroreductase family)